MWKKFRALVDRRIGWLILAVLVSWLPGWLGADWIERYYSEGVYIYIRLAQDALSWIAPFPLIYILLLLITISVLLSLFRLYRKVGSVSAKIFSLALNAAGFIAAFIFFFQILWGWNYARVPVAEKMGLNIKPFPPDELEADFFQVTDSLLALRARLHNQDSLALDATWLPDELGKRLRKNLKATLEEHAYNNQGQVRVRAVRPEGVLLRFGTAGIYLPWVGEGHYDSGLHPIQIPYVMAHEMAHGYGFGDEGVCNFWAYLTCLRSSNDFVRYSGTLGYWRYLASEYRRQAPEAYKEAYHTYLTSSIRADLRAIYENSERFPDLMPRVRDFAYDTYLKAQGVEDGLKSYSQVIMMVHAWNLKKRESSN